MNSLRHALCMLLLVGSVVTAGCSTKAWYDGLKAAADNDCRLRQPPGETEKCLARLNTMTYEEYERKRSGRNP